ncbi:biosynthetic peptidoglycan transglycosylase [uncultured Pseudacidovorax sp.]|uniref:biosynthetic peptidoglycan transglycosylase n=1 Tax=uncultured Pseudacidovorax sp. TaxID=679313 RepID=UPI0025EF4B9A|nr:biosynthetic peptidoglycan transglycosylase [uncultured Pseudacidovorax sp.]
MNKALRLLLWGLLALLLTAAVAAAAVLRIGLAPARDEWAVDWRLGPVTVPVGVPTVLRLATSPWIGPRLDGRRLQTVQGPIDLRWDAPRRQLALRCAPCRLGLSAMGSQPLQLAELRVTAQRDVDRLAGDIDAVPAAEGGAPAAPGLHGRWQGRLTQRDLHIDAQFDDAPIARWYAVLAPGLPELGRARIGGTAGGRLQVQLPAGTLGLQPRVGGFTVEGLGTDALLGARSNCGPSANLKPDSWLARAVLAAEDQRFFQHPGFDLIELQAAFDRNQHKGAVERGGSTLTQQLAKVLVTGGERTLQRKLRELLYAVDMEQQLGKARILQLYLDHAPWGRVCGAEAAARFYFGRSAARLEPAQAVWLAAMLHAPSAAAERWQREGGLDPQRVQWVAEGIRGISRAQREALLRSVAQARYPWPGSTPAPAR